MSIEKFRILYISSQFPTQLNPQSGVFSVERVRALARAGCGVAVVAPVLLTPPPGLVARPNQLLRWWRQQTQLPDRSWVEDVVVRHPKWFCPPKQIFGWYFCAFESLQMRRMVEKAAAQLRPQIILSSWLPDGVAACRLGKHLGLPVLCIADGSDVNEWTRKYPYWHFARETLNRDASAIIYVSDALHRAGVANGLHPCFDAVIHNAVDVQVFTPGPNDRQADAFSILAAGRMTPVKGYHVLLEAFAEFVLRFNRPASLTLVGDGALRPELQAQAAALGIAAQVHFAGGVAPDRMQEYYQKADLLCLPSFSEGLPCVAVEAMACGVPVVASAVGGVPELVDHHSGILVPPGDPKALYAALLQAADRSWDTQAIRQKVLDGFSWRHWTDKLFEVIHSVMAKRLEEVPLAEREKVWPA
jgi:glycosyltransferase involved in cell wall biosynthesis